MKYKEYSGYSTEQLKLSLKLYGKKLQKFIVFFSWGRGGKTGLGVMGFEVSDFVKVRSTHLFVEDSLFN
jgi:hypothetical protein